MGDDTMDSVRWDLIQKARDRIRSGAYMTHHVLETTVDRVLLAIDGELPDDYKSWYDKDCKS